MIGFVCMDGTPRRHEAKSHCSCQGYAETSIMDITSLRNLLCLFHRSWSGTNTERERIFWGDSVIILVPNCY